MEAKCLYFGRCGGCSAQHIPYDTQLDNKKNQLAHALKIDAIDSIHDKEYFYRNRMDFIFSANGLGLRKKKDWKSIVPVDTCVIAEPQINKMLKEVNTFFKNADIFNIHKQQGTFRYAVMRVTPNDSGIVFTLNSASSKLGESIDLVKEFAKRTTIPNIMITRVPPQTDVSLGSDGAIIKGKSMLSTIIQENKFNYAMQGFFQNNTAMAQKMHDYVHSLLKKHDTKQAHLLDIYGGVGTFGIINADLFKSVHVIESVAECIESAQENIKLNHKKNITTQVLDAKSLRKIELASPLFVITDPPRSGMHPKTIHQLNILRPKVIIYVSCNIAQLAKEISKFKEYEIKSAAVLDLFPQTPHGEAVVELVRKEI